ncbi:hypothetical protein FRZ06_00665 [Anoxybacterium hadale]|uniref:Uncharacterized protein n=1 Tax=Anoxybacterium hadale TaxID=3408580 RepID=A0ACD1A6I4_9FIRM|nr:hypothetical protein FRZ06_00665 [Clostridiales bacterium]
MQDHDTRYGPQNWLIFRTQPGAVTIPAGETARLNENLEGFDIASYYTIRIYASSRQSSTVPATFSPLIQDRENKELIFSLGTFTLQPGESFTQTYDVPGRALSVFVRAGDGTGQAYIDFGVLGFGPRPHGIC